jgi:hypothetical protein
MHSHFCGDKKTKWRLLKHIVTGDENWVHYYDPETKITIEERRHSSSPNPKNFRTPASAGKLMLALFWHHQLPLVKQNTSEETTVTSASYYNLLTNHVRPTIRSKRRGLLSAGVLLLHVNFRTHTGRVAAETIRHIRVTPSSIVPARLGSLWRPFPWVTQGGSWWKDFQIRWRSAGGGESGYACSQEISFTRNPGISEALKGIHWTQWGLCWQMTKLYQTLCTKFAGNKLLNLSVDSLKSILRIPYLTDWSWKWHSYHVFDQTNDLLTIPRVIN